MIAYLRGYLIARTAQQAILDVNGVGYAVYMSGSDLAALPEKGTEMEMLTHLQVSEAGVALYGFLSQAGQDLFQQLIGVSGVGPKVALAALGCFPPEELAQAIAREDVTKVAKIPGVGKKTAQRMILELKGSLAWGGGTEGLFAENGVSAPASAGIDDVAEGVREALLSMGFTGREAELALKGAPDGASEGALLQFALKKLGS